MNSEPQICLLEDDPIMGESLCERFALEGLGLDWYTEAGAAFNAIAKHHYAAIITDIRLPDMDGEQFFEQLLEQQANIPPILFITGFGSVDQAVRLLQHGARDYITKPFDLDELLAKLRQMIPADPGEDPHHGWEPFLGISYPMRRVEAVLRRMAANRSPVLITGESGVGKEYAACFLKDSVDIDAHCVTVNCAAMPENLLESERFGYEKGAFTGAVRMHRGVFERADKGFLFLDEIGDMPTNMQAKLLRVIQDGQVVRIGSETPIKCDVRLICATNHDLQHMVEIGEFREDLYYRINVVHVHLPPIRERRQDIIWFAHKFIEEYVAEHTDQRILTPAGERYLLNQQWPGNLRELKHAVVRACIFSQSVRVGAREFELPNGCDIENSPPAQPSPELSEYIGYCESTYILEALEAHQWRIAETAGVLGISRKNLWEKIKKHRLAAK